MYVFELAVITAIGILVAGVMGFLFGIGYQRSEDFRGFNDLRKESMRLVEKAYRQGREDAEKDRKKDINEFLDDVLKEKDEIKFGGF